MTDRNQDPDQDPDQDLDQGQTQHARNIHYPQRPVQTLARAYAEIVAQREQASPWVALNEFFHEWWDYSRTEHAQLIAEEVLSGGPPVLLEAPSRDLSCDLALPERAGRWRWAVFCAAVADYLSAREGMEPPAWVADPRYTLAEPWYVLGTAGAGDTGNAGDDEKALSPKRRLYLEQTTPPQFRRRNIFCSDRLFANKYEFTQQVKQLVAARAAQAARADHTGHIRRASQTAPSTPPSVGKPTQAGG